MGETFVLEGLASNPLNSYRRKRTLGACSGLLLTILVQFDLALVDVVMPGVNDDDSLRLMISEREIPFIDKPYSAAELVAKVRGVLGVEHFAPTPVLAGS